MASILTMFLQIKEDKQIQIYDKLRENLFLHPCKMNIVLPSIEKETNECFDLNVKSNGKQSESLNGHVSDFLSYIIKFHFTHA